MRIAGLGGPSRRVEGGDTGKAQNCQDASTALLLHNLGPLRDVIDYAQAAAVLVTGSGGMRTDPLDVESGVSDLNRQGSAGQHQRDRHIGASVLSGVASQFADDEGCREPVLFDHVPVGQEKRSKAAGLPDPALLGWQRLRCASSQTQQFVRHTSMTT